MKIAQSIWFCAVLLSMLFAPSAVAQVADMAPRAPIPTRILNGKTVFISNAGVDLSSLAAYVTTHTGAPNGLYNEFYADIKNWGKYQLVDSPADAELVFEIELLLPHPEVGANPDVQVRIFEPKTHIILWQLIEPVGAGSGRPTTRRKHWETAITKLVNDMKQLVSQPAGKS